VLGIPPSIVEHPSGNNLLSTGSVLGMPPPTIDHQSVNNLLPAGTVLAGMPPSAIDLQSVKNLLSTGTVLGIPRSNIEHQSFKTELLSTATVLGMHPSAIDHQSVKNQLLTGIVQGMPLSTIYHRSAKNLLSTGTLLGMPPPTIDHQSVKNPLSTATVQGIPLSTIYHQSATGGPAPTNHGPTFVSKVHPPQQLPDHYVLTGCVDSLQDRQRRQNSREYNARRYKAKKLAIAKLASTVGESAPMSIAMLSKSPCRTASPICVPGATQKGKPAVSISTVQRAVPLPSNLLPTGSVLEMHLATMYNQSATGGPVPIRPGPMFVSEVTSPTPLPDHYVATGCVASPKERQRRQSSRDYNSRRYRAKRLGIARLTSTESRSMLDKVHGQAAEPDAPQKGEQSGSISTVQRVVPQPSNMPRLSLPPKVKAKVSAVPLPTLPENTSRLCLPPKVKVKQPALPFPLPSNMAPLHLPKVKVKRPAVPSSSSMQPLFLPPKIKVKPPTPYPFPSNMSRLRLPPKAKFPEKSSKSANSRV
jgi:hypothetical protein